MQPEQNFEDLLAMEVNYERASTGRRFANYIIDFIVFYVVIILLAIILGIFAPTLIEELTDDNSSLGLLDRIVTLILYAVFMSINEIWFKGKSVGKYITKTRAVNVDGSRISASTAFARGFSRAVPFCALSAFGNPCNPWQDKWTNTIVVNG
jgi:uncharacterized RDD family membrane protein YckC